MIVLFVVVSTLHAVSGADEQEKKRTNDGLGNFPLPAGNHLLPNACCGVRNSTGGIHEERRACGVSEGIRS